MTKAQKGDLVKIIQVIGGKGQYREGDICEVIGTWGNGVLIDVEGPYNDIYHTEYEIHRKAGEEDDTMTNTKAQKGDLIRIVSLDNGKGEAKAFDSSYSIGDILEVEEVSGEITVTTNKSYLFDHEFEIHRKAGEEDSFVPAQSQSVIAGVGTDAPIVANEVGAKQSFSPYRMDLIDAKALLKIAQVHKQGGDKYGDTNWRGIPVNDHINHALVHVYAYLAGDNSDEHLSHAATRMIFALAQELDAKSTENS